MTLADAPLAQSPPDRKDVILDAAERAIVRNGFHKTTMQDLAAECGMSPGNLYRYFPSKDAIVAGLAERDRLRMNADMAVLRDAGDPMAAFMALGRRHLVEEPRGKAIMLQEIWAEACRNPKVAEICQAMDLAIGESVQTFVEQWRRHENATGLGSPAEVAGLIIALGDGLLRRRATDPDFDPARAFGLALPVILHMIGVRNADERLFDRNN
jgi:AcrR family transcriptional regulator